MPKAAKARKTKVTPAEKVSKPHVISFRLNDAQFECLKTTFGGESIIGVSSERQFARKLVCDYMRGKLKYTNPKDKLADLEAYAS